MLHTKILPPSSCSLELAASTFSVLLQNICFFSTAAFICFITSVASEILLYSSGSETPLTSTHHVLPFIAFRVVQVVQWLTSLKRPFWSFLWLFTAFPWFTALLYSLLLLQRYFWVRRLSNIIGRLAVSVTVILYSQRLIGTWRLDTIFFSPGLTTAHDTYFVFLCMTNDTWFGITSSTLATDTIHQFNNISSTLWLTIDCWLDNVWSTYWLDFLFALQLISWFNIFTILLLTIIWRVRSKIMLTYIRLVFGYKIIANYKSVMECKIESLGFNEYVIAYIVHWKTL